MVWTRLEWGPRAIGVFQTWADVVVVIDVLSGTSHRSPEAAAAAAVYADTADDLSKRLADCTSGRELRERGYGADVTWAAAVDASKSVPLLVDGIYVATP